MKSREEVMRTVLVLKPTKISGRKRKPAQIVEVDDAVAEELIRTRVAMSAFVSLGRAREFGIETLSQLKDLLGGNFDEKKG
jgi:hypothetical protein